MLLRETRGNRAHIMSFREFAGRPGANRFRSSEACHDTITFRSEEQYACTLFELTPVYIVSSFGSVIARCGSWSQLPGRLYN